MPKTRQITTINLPAQIVGTVGSLLEQAGFGLGTVGGGYGQMEKEGTLTGKQKDELIAGMAELVFDFIEEDIPED